MTKIESIIALLKANTAADTVAPSLIASYANLAETTTLETISSTIMAGSILKPGFEELPKAKVLDQMFISLFGYTQAELDALKATEAGATGYEYWINELNNNPNMINVNTLAIALLNGASAEDSAKAKALVAADVAAYEAYVGSEEETEGQAFQLTDGRDTKNGTDGNDTFYAEVGQNQDGALANAFATGDVIDGKGGSKDTLEAAIMGDNGVDNSENFAINAKTTNLEIAKFTALDENVTVDAGRMDSVEEFWSNDSDNVKLTIEDVRLGSKLSITDDLSFGMQSVDFESDLIAELDSQSFVKDADDKLNSQIVIEVGDSNKPANSTNPLELIKLTINFTFGGQDYSLLDLESADGTYEGLKTAVEEALAAEGLTGLNVTYGKDLSQITAANDTVPLLYSGAKQIIITDPAGAEFTKFTSGVGAKPSAQSSNPVSNTTAVAPSSSTPLIETNILLDDAGRSSTAGDFEVNGMSNSGKGIQKFDVYVDRDSSIASLTSKGKDLRANGDLDYRVQEIEINSKDFDNDANTTATGSLEIGKLNDGIKLIEADAFKGTALMLGTTSEGVGIAVNNLVQLDASIAGDVTFVGKTTEADGVSSGNNYDYDTGSGKDTVTFTLDGNSVDALGESFSINTGSGDDTVTVSMTAGVSQATMAKLNNLSIDLGDGDDTLLLNGQGNFDVKAGNGSDFVEIDSLSTTDGTNGVWSFGQATGAQNFGEKVLYQAELTIIFAGFESTVKVPTDKDGNFIATQSTINEAIIAAIENSDVPEMGKLLNYEYKTGTQVLEVTSTVDGANELAINLYQPRLELSTALSTNVTTGEVQINTNDLTALKQGLIDTNEVVSSTAVATETHVQNVINTNIHGSLNASAAVVAGTGIQDGTVANLASANAHYQTFSAGTSTAGTEATVEVNFSTIDAGAGSNDLVSFHSNDASANVLEITGSFGKTSVVNFHDVSPNAVAAATDVGNHAIDFTAILDNQLDPSTAPGNSQSVVDKAITLNFITNHTPLGSAPTNLAAAANSVTMLMMDETTTVSSVKFADLTAADLVSALNGGAGATVIDNITSTTLDADNATANNTTLVGNTLQHIVMVENELNPGEYKVFNLTSTKTSVAADIGKFDTGATLLGTLDFGASINFNLVGSDEWAVMTTGVKVDGSAVTAADSATLNALATAGTIFKQADVAAETESTTAAANVTTVSASQAVTGDGTTASPYMVINKAGNQVELSTIKTVEATATLSATAAAAMTMSGVTGAITITGTNPTIAQANYIAGKFSGAVTATLTAATAASLNAGLTNLVATDLITLVTSDTTIDAAIAISLDAKTATAVDITTNGTTISGTAANVAAVWAAAGITTNAADNSTLTDTTLDATVAEKINTAGTGAIDISAATTINATTTEALAIVGNTGAAYTTSATYALTVEGSDMTSANYTDIQSDTTGAITATVTQAGGVETLALTLNAGVLTDKINVIGATSASDKITVATTNTGVTAEVVGNVGSPTAFAIETVANGIVDAANNGTLTVADLTATTLTAVATSISNAFAFTDAGAKAAVTNMFAVESDTDGTWAMYTWTQSAIGDTTVDAAELTLVGTVTSNDLVAADFDLV